MRRAADYHLMDMQGRPVGTFQSSQIIRPGRLSGVQSIFPTIIPRRGSQPLNTDPQNLGGYTLTTVIPFRSSLPGPLSAPACTLDRVACQMPLFPDGHVPLMGRIIEGALKTYGVRSCVPQLDRWRQAIPIHRVAPVHR